MPYIAPEVISEVKRIDLLTYLQEREPDELVRVSPTTFCTKEHDSLKISNGKWYWWSRGVGGRSALDFLIKVRGMTFLGAVEHLCADGALAAQRIAGERRPPAAPARPTFRPPRRSDDAIAMQYLTSRGISRQVLSELMRRGDVYATLRGGEPHVAFIGRDPSGAARYAALRSCTGSYKGEAAGSNKRYSFALAGNEASTALHVFESAIDALSYATLALMQGRSWREIPMLSLGGVAVPRAGQGKPKPPAALLQRIESRGQTTDVILHLDNDDAGRAAAKAIARALEAQGVHAKIAHPPAEKDMNEFLLAKLAREPRGVAGRAR